MTLPLAPALLWRSGAVCERMWQNFRNHQRLSEDCWAEATLQSKLYGIRGDMHGVAKFIAAAGLQKQPTKANGKEERSDYLLSPR